MQETVHNTNSTKGANISNTTLKTWHENPEKNKQDPNFMFRMLQLIPVYMTNPSSKPLYFQFELIPVSQPFYPSI